ncbi:hypothetical protein CHELA1G11_14278 [Hyphomicrobiales bacterium]|nr:hypothetical protein CHELA1G2_10036 [Hyphomicrobiales bacterium]CAH1677482.1 hypothetical protein CHELA1G11_14278 [Hyphomicrobiales bacterium]
MPGDVTRQLRERDAPLGPQRRVRIILNNRDAMLPRQRHERAPPRLGQCRGRGVVDGGNEIKRLWRPFTAYLCEGVGNDAFIIHGQRFQDEPLLRRDGLQTGISHRTGRNPIATTEQKFADGEQRALRAPRDHDPIAGHSLKSRCQPARGSLAIRLRAGARLIMQAQHATGAAQDGRDALGKSPSEIRLGRLRRDIHAEIDQRRRLLGHDRPVTPLADEGPASGLGLDEAASAGLVEGARHRGEIHLQRFRDRALRRKPLPPRNPARLNISLERLDDPEIFHAGAFDQSRLPHPVPQTVRHINIQGRIMYGMVTGSQTGWMIDRLALSAGIRVGGTIDVDCLKAGFPRQTNAAGKWVHARERTAGNAPNRRGS